MRAISLLTIAALAIPALLPFASATGTVNAVFYDDEFAIRGVATFDVSYTTSTATGTITLANQSLTIDAQAVPTEDPAFANYTEYKGNATTPTDTRPIQIIHDPATDLQTAVIWKADGAAVGVYGAPDASLFSSIQSIVLLNRTAYPQVTLFDVNNIVQIGAPATPPTTLPPLVGVTSSLPLNTGIIVPQSGESTRGSFYDGPGPKNEDGAQLYSQIGEDLRNVNLASSSNEINVGEADKHMDFSVYSPGIVSTGLAATAHIEAHFIDRLQGIPGSPEQYATPLTMLQTGETMPLGANNPSTVSFSFGLGWGFGPFTTGTEFYQMNFPTNCNFKETMQSPYHDASMDFCFNGVGQDRDHALGIELNYAAKDGAGANYMREFRATVIYQKPVCASYLFGYYCVNVAHTLLSSDEYLYAAEQYDKWSGLNQQYCDLGTYKCQTDLYEIKAADAVSWDGHTCCQHVKTYYATTGTITNYHTSSGRAWTTQPKIEWTLYLYNPSAKTWVYQSQDTLPLGSAGSGGVYAWWDQVAASQNQHLTPGEYRWEVWFKTPYPDQYVDSLVFTVGQ